MSIREQAERLMHELFEDWTEELSNAGVRFSRNSKGYERHVGIIERELSAAVDQARAETRNKLLTFAQASQEQYSEAGYDLLLPHDGSESKTSQQWQTLATLAVKREVCEMFIGVIERMESASPHRDGAVNEAIPVEIPNRDGDPDSVPA